MSEWMLAQSCPAPSPSPSRVSTAGLPEAFHPPPLAQFPSSSIKRELTLFTLGTCGRRKGSSER